MNLDQKSKCLLLLQLLKIQITMYYLLIIEAIWKVIGITLNYLQDQTSVDARNANYVIRVAVVDLSAVRYSAKDFYKRGIAGSKNIQKFVKNGFKRPLGPYQNREEVAKSSFDFDLVVSVVQNDILGSAERIITQNLLRLRYDQDNNAMSLREPFIEELRRLIPSIYEENLSSNETVASARDLSVISQIFKSSLEQAANQINCEVELLKTYDSGTSSNDGIRLNQGLLIWCQHWRSLYFERI